MIRFPCYVQDVSIGTVVIRLRNGVVYRECNAIRLSWDDRFYIVRSETSQVIVCIADIVSVEFIGADRRKAGPVRRAYE